MNETLHPVDEETLARAVLTYCLDSTDAMMYALLKGTGSATSALQLIADCSPGKHEGIVTAACKALDAAFINGITRWGRTINARGMSSFHGSLASWQQRLATLPSHDPQQLDAGSRPQARSGSSPLTIPIGHPNSPICRCVPTGPPHYAYGGVAILKHWSPAPNRWA